MSKAEAAERQLVVAIDLWFHDRDILAVHSLASATYQVLRKLHEHHGTGFVGARETLVSLGRSKAEQKELTEALNRAANYLKHADKDPDETLDYNPDMTFLLMVECSKSLQALNGRFPPECNALLSWFALNYQMAVGHKHPMFAEAEGPIQELTKDGMPPKLEVLQLAKQAIRSGA